MQTKTFWVIVSAAVGTLQMWDSDIAHAGIMAAVLAIAGIAVPTASIAVRMDSRVRIGALAAGVILLMVARMSSPVPLNTLHLALFPAALYILFVQALSHDGRRPEAA